MGEPLRARLRRGAPAGNRAMIVIATMEHVAREFTNALGARFHFVTDADLWDAFRQRPKALNAAPSTTKSARNVPKYANLTIICYL